MTQSKATGAASARRRLQRADAAAVGLDETLSAAAATQAAAVVRAWNTDARSDAQALTAAAGDDLPAPQFQWQHLWNSALWASTLEDAELLVAEFVVDELDIEFGIQVVSSQPFVERLAAENVAGIEAWTQDFRARIGDVIDRGHREAMSVKQVADVLVDAGDAVKRQATLISRTEMVASSNAASFRGATAIAEPGDTKIWMSARDDRTRPDHREADGQEVPIDEPFRVGGSLGDHPGDARLPAGQRANCRCSFRVVHA